MISDATINIEPAVIELDLGHPRQNVRFGSKADMCSAKRYVRFTLKAADIQVLLTGTFDTWPLSRVVRSVLSQTAGGEWSCRFRTLQIGSTVG